MGRIIEAKGMGCRRRFLVRWAGYRPQWEPWRIRHHRGCRGSDRDVGADELAEGHRGSSCLGHGAGLRLRVSARQSRRRQAGDTDMTAPGTQATPQATQSTAPMRSSSVGRPKEERCSKGVCLAAKADLRGVQAQLKNAQTVLERERSQRATLMGGEIRRIEVERDEALRQLNVLRNEHQRALEVCRSARRLVV